MNLTEFKNLLARHGEDLASWPDEFRDEANAFLQSSSPARDLMADIAILNKIRKTPPSLKAPQGLSDRILAEALRRSPPVSKEK